MNADLFDILDRADRLGLRLEPRGDMLAVIPKGKCPPGFASILRKHKRGLLRLLSSPMPELAKSDIAAAKTLKRVESITGEMDEAMREEFHRVWIYSIAPLLPESIKPGSEESFKIFTCCWIAYCVGIRAVAAPTGKANG